MTQIYRFVGDCVKIMGSVLEPASIHAVVTSPPYFGLRDNKVKETVWPADSSSGCEHTFTTPSGLGRKCENCLAWIGQLGGEPDPWLYADHLVQVMREVRRVLRPDGTVWLNVGDSYAGSNNGAGDKRPPGSSISHVHGLHTGEKPGMFPGRKPLDQIGVPWIVYFALIKDGWYGRGDVVWHKPNGKPSSGFGWRWVMCEKMVGGKKTHCTGCPKCQDNMGYVLRKGNGKPSRVHEFMFQLQPTKSAYYDDQGVLEVAVGQGMRHKRSVWSVNTVVSKFSNFSVFPPELVEPCIIASTSNFGVCIKCHAPWVRVLIDRVVGHPMTVGWRRSCQHEQGNDTARAVVLDPFAGQGTVGLVSRALNRDVILIEANADTFNIQVPFLAQKYQPKTLMLI